MPWFDEYSQPKTVTEVRHMQEIQRRKMEQENLRQRHVFLGIDPGVDSDMYRYMMGLQKSPSTQSNSVDRKKKLLLLTKTN
jgi:hypothetical protein